MQTQTLTKKITNADLNQIRLESIDLLAKSAWGQKYGDLIEKLRQVPMTFNTRLRTAGGRCLFRRNAYTKLVVELLTEVSYEYALVASLEELVNTVKHELAHAFQVLKNNSTDHGYEWKLIHAAMGGTTERCHKVKVRKNRVTRIRFSDNTTGKIYTCTPRKWKEYQYYGNFKDGQIIKRFTFMESFVRE